MSTVAVLDYGAGNVRSAVRAVEAAGAEVVLTADRSAIDAADGLLVPGVGAYSAVIAGLTRIGGDELIRSWHEASDLCSASASGCRSSSPAEKSTV